MPPLPHRAAAANPAESAPASSNPHAATSTQPPDTPPETARTSPQTPPAPPSPAPRSIFRRPSDANPNLPRWLTPPEKPATRILHPLLRFCVSLEEPNIVSAKVSPSFVEGIAFAPSLHLADVSHVLRLFARSPWWVRCARRRRTARLPTAAYNHCGLEMSRSSRSHGATRKCCLAAM